MKRTIIATNSIKELYIIIGAGRSSIDTIGGAINCELNSISTERDINNPLALEVLLRIATWPSRCLETATSSYQSAPTGGGWKWVTRSSIRCQLVTTITGTGVGPSRIMTSLCTVVCAC